MSAPPLDIDSVDRVNSLGEYPTVFQCGAEQLSGVIHRGDPGQHCGVVIVVAGGPQYRVGAHRQFVELARRLVGQGYTVMRFDLKGMGDSSGQHTGYQQSRADIRAAIDHFLVREPHLREVVLFGECASASGILFYAYSDPRVTRLALANPWVRTAEGRAEVILKYYYVDRMLSHQFWRDVFAGRVGIAKSLGSLGDVVRTYVRGLRAARNSQAVSERDDLDGLPLPVRTAEGLRRFQGPVLIIMSGRDYIAREFDAVTKATPAWRGLLTAPGLTRYEVQGADHTFSKAEWKADAQNALLSWLRESNATG